MGKADLKVTVGLLVLGVVIGGLILKFTGPTNQLRQSSVRPTGNREAVHQKVSPATSMTTHGLAAPQASVEIPPLPLPTQAPKAPPQNPPSEQMLSAQAKVITVDAEHRGLVVDILTRTGGPPPETPHAALSDTSTTRKTIQLSEMTRLEKRIVEKAPPGQPDKVMTQQLQLADLHPGDVVFCTYRTETPEALQGVETLSLPVEMDIDAYLNSEEYTAWLATQPAYVKGRIVAIDPARRTITYQGYVVNRIPKGFPRQTVVVGQGGQVYDVEDENRLEAPQRRRALNELRPGQTILFPVTRALLQTGAKTYHTDTVLVIGKGG